MIERGYKMALITKRHFSHIEKERSNVHESVDATYCTFTKGENKYFQIDTYGSENRQIKDKISQSIQLDREMAIELVELLQREFNLKLR